MLNCHRERIRKLSKSFTVVIQHLSTRLIKPNFFNSLKARLEKPRRKRQLEFEMNRVWKIDEVAVVYK